MELVSVVVVTRNGIRFLPETLRALKRQTYKNLELIFVDNASTDGSPEFVESNYPSATVIRCPTNTGFSRGNNIGIKLASGDCALVLNQDVYLEADFIDNIVQVLRSDPCVGTACGKLYTARLGGARTGIIDSAGMVLLRNRNALNRGNGSHDPEFLNEPAEVFGSPAAAVLYRKKMLDELRIGEEYFDEDFFAYFEDVDLSWRARRLGWKTVYTPKAVGYHVRVSGLFVAPGGAHFVSRISWRNRYLAIFKNESFLDLLLSLPWIVPFELSHMVASLVYHRWRFGALAQALRLLPRIVRKRRAFARSAPRHLLRLDDWLGVDSRPYSIAERRP